MNTDTMFFAMLLMAFLAGGSLMLAFSRSRPPVMYAVPVVESGNSDAGCLLTALLVAVTVVFLLYFGLA